MRMCRRRLIPARLFEVVRSMWVVNMFEFWFWGVAGPLHFSDGHSRCDFDANEFLRCQSRAGSRGRELQ